jgi:isopenicillin N synthase-like dioxygenase
MIPTINLQQIEVTGEGLSELDAACREHGFFLLSHHGLDKAINSMWAASKAFFAKPSVVKREVERTESIPLGYYDRELTKRQRDLKEVFDYMQSRADGSDLNQWPAGQPEFRRAMDAFFDAASQVAERTLAQVYRALGATSLRDAMLPQGDARTSTVRLNYYPPNDPLSPEEQAETTGLGDMALHHHTDPGILTLLVQDMSGGLQTLSTERGWLDVTPEAGTIVVNLGDAMQVWSNDLYRAAIHRVLPMRDIGCLGRFSTPYFFNPSRDAVLEPLSALSDTAPQYRSFTWKDYIKGRVDDNFADIGEDDIQIERFRISH